jgi:hypothetical protein
VSIVWAKIKGMAVNVAGKKGTWEGDVSGTSGKENPANYMVIVS